MWYLSDFSTFNALKNLVLKPTYIKPLLLKVNEQNNRVEVKLPDGQIIAFEQFLGEVRMIHWTEPNNDTIEPIVVPLIEPKETNKKLDLQLALESIDYLDLEPNPDEIDLMYQYYTDDTDEALGNPHQISID